MGLEYCSVIGWLVRILLCDWLSTNLDEVAPLIRIVEGNGKVHGIVLWNLERYVLNRVVCVYQELGW